MPTSPGKQPTDIFDPYYARELADTLQAQRQRNAKRCKYCGTRTRSTIGVCLDHIDLPMLDANMGGVPRERTA